MFGRSSRLPIDSMFTVGIGVTKQKTYDQFVSDWKNQLNEAIKIAQQKANKSAEQNRNQYNRKVHGNDIVIGDRVLLRNFSERGGTAKLRVHWENTIYVVVGKEDNLPAYNIKPENSKGTSTKKVHRNIIMSCNRLPSTPKINNNKNYKSISQDKSIQSDSNVSGDNCDSDSDSEIIILQPQLYQNYNDPPAVPEVNQSEPVLDFQEGEKENSDTESESEITKQLENSLNTGVPRRPERVRKKTKIFTYNELGQAPSYVTQNNS